MDRLKYILLIILVVPNGIIAQDSVVNRIFRLYPNCTNFDTKVYLQEKDTCVDLIGFEQINLSIKETDEIRIENKGKGPIHTTLEKIVKGQLEMCENLLIPIPKNEISPRRIRRLSKDVQYFCYENEQKISSQEISKQIIGLYKNCEETFFKIEENELFEFSIIKDGYEISNHTFNVEDDKLKCENYKNFYWDQKENKLMENVDFSPKNLEIEICYLLKDCRQNHITTLMSMSCWIKQNENESFENIIKSIKNY